MKRSLLFLVLLVSILYSQSQDPSAPAAQRPITYKKKRLRFHDDFSKGLDTSVWKPEIAPLPSSTVSVINGQLVLDTKGGVTVWLKKLLQGDILIEYKRTVLMEGGANDRVSDLNQFWMAADPRNPQLFTRTGVFGEYDSLRLYYVGMGGNINTTTRFRKYLGDGQKPLLQEYLDTAHLLQANKTYLLQTIVYKGIIQFLVDGVPYFTWKDDQPLTSGYFGFRATASRQVIDEVKVYRLE